MTNKSQLFSILYNQNGTIILTHHQFHECLIKISNKDFSSSQAQHQILSMIPSYIQNICRILYLESVVKDNQQKTIEIISKVSGYSKMYYSNEEKKLVLLATKELQENINSSHSKDVPTIPTIAQLFPNILNQTTIPKLKEIGTSLQQDYTFQIMQNSTSEIIVADLVYENILFDANQVNFIDLDPLILGPKELQIAILLTSNILLQLRDIKLLEMSDITSFYHQWGIQLTRQDLLYLSIFPLLMLSMKNIDINGIGKKPFSLYYKLKTLLLFFTLI
jgi:hypothetical protein